MKIPKAFEDTTDVFDLLDRSEQQLFEVAEGNIRKDYQDMKSVIQEVMDGIDQARLNEDGVSGTPTGFKGLDTQHLEGIDHGDHVRDIIGFVHGIVEVLLFLL